jgi:predicted nucleic acid-binding protein
VILADTSAWVEYDRATGSPVDLRLTGLIAEDDAVAVTEPVMAEVLAGARDGRREADLRRLLSRFHLLRFRAATDFDGAVSIYRSCRRQGITPRGLLDCMIAAVAIRTRVPVLALDGDFGAIASVMALDLDPATPTNAPAGRESPDR